MTARERFDLRVGIAKARLREWLRFDCVPAHRVAALGGFAWSRLLDLIGRRASGLRARCAVHRSAYSDTVNRWIERIVRRGRAASPSSPGSIRPLLRDYVAALRPRPETERYFAPAKILGTRALVLKSPARGEKGVIVLHYSYVFPIFAQLFDVEAIAERYHLVLEPSWSGYCDLDVLTYAQYAFPVFVEAYEPRDAAFIRAIDSNLAVVPLSSNWWVDHRVFRPIPGVVKDVDVVMVSGWAWFKRHYALFAALRTLRRRGVRPRVVLIGYRMDMTKEDVLRQADAFGVLDQIECHERLSQDEVNHHFNRAKVNLLWSRREGVNRAIIEGMFAGVPCILRDGFNYGHHYEYVNAATGRYSSEADLPDTLLEMIESHEAYAPRDWVMANMSCQGSARTLDRRIGEVSATLGQPWSGGDLAVKITGLNRLYYWDPACEERFADDYAYLLGATRARR